VAEGKNQDEMQRGDNYLTANTTQKKKKEKTRPKKEAEAVLGKGGKICISSEVNEGLSQNDGE